MIHMFGLRLALPPTLPVPTVKNTVGVYGLSEKEKARRRKRNQMARVSRRNNRR